MKSDDQILFEDSEGIDRGALLRRVALGGAAASLPALAGAQAAFGASEKYPSHPSWKFAFINHVTTNPFFVPTQYGAADASAPRATDLHVRLDASRRRRD
jgi:simple sugar transport system substrate-binding protein